MYSALICLVSRGADLSAPRRKSKGEARPEMLRSYSGKITPLRRRKLIRRDRAFICPTSRGARPRLQRNKGKSRPRAKVAIVICNAELPVTGLTFIVKPYEAPKSPVNIAKLGGLFSTFWISCAFRMRRLSFCHSYFYLSPHTGAAITINYAPRLTGRWRFNVTWGTSLCNIDGPSRFFIGPYIRPLRCVLGRDAVSYAHGRRFPILSYHMALVYNIDDAKCRPTI